MSEIGLDFKLARTSSSVSLDEASSDTGIPVTSLEQIEEGNIGIFKDIFELKGYLQTYAKYLGLDPDKIIDRFNEYMFEYTSKIPLNDLEKAIATKEKEEEELETNEIKVVSPYLKPKEESKIAKYVITIIVIIILVTITLIWAIKQVMLG